MKERPILLVFRYLAFILLFLCAGLLCMLLAGYIGKASDPASAFSPIPAAEVRVVIDAGHGGMDGGASSADGLLEKEINLAVAGRMAELADVMGIPAVMTRTGDEMLSDGGGGSAKMRDLRTRLTLAESHPSAVFVSIHCNKFPDARCRGLQVYYSPNNMRSRALAGLMQSDARLYLDPGNTRSIKEAGSSIYLLDRMNIPAVLVECGFLSHPEEAALLADGAYQQKLAAVILSSAANLYSTELQEEG